MFDTLSSAELIGYLAGLVMLSSSLPQLVVNFRDPSLAASQSGGRNLLQALGNLMWLIYAILVGAQPMIVFAGLGFVLASWLLLQVLMSNRSE